MNTINIAADATAQRIGIGNQYENLATAVVFDCSKFAEDHGAGTAQVIHRRPTESVGYVCTNVSQTNNTVTWLVTDDDTSFTGKGLVQLRWYVNDVLRESVIFPTYILPSVVSSDDAPADVKSALEQIMEWVNDNTISIEDLDERIANYFDEHPIPTPVTSVNEKLGDVVLTAEDVGAYSTEEADEKFCVPDGEYEELNAGTAKQLLSDSYTLDQVPYLYRKSPDSDRAVESIVGGTVGWNQLCNSSSVTVQSGHKYLSKIDGTYYVGSSTGTAITDLTSGTDMVFDLTILFGTTIADYIYTLEQSTEGAGVSKLKEWGFFTEDYYEYCEPTLKSVEGLQSKNTVGFNQWDEEWELGYYNISTGTPTSADDRIRSKNKIPVIPNTSYCFSKPTGKAMSRLIYYDANGDFLRSADVISTENTSTVITIDQDVHYVNFNMGSAYGATYNHDICINLSDPSRNGTYEPYEKHSYPLDSSVTLRGVPKLVTDHIEFDGDKYLSDGTLERRSWSLTIDGSERWSFYRSDGSTDLNSFTCKPFGTKTPKEAWSGTNVNDAIASNGYPVSGSKVYAKTGLSFAIDSSESLMICTDQATSVANFKTYLASNPITIVYLLTTPTTETAQPFHNPQIVGDTEEFVTTGLVPVGHSTKYYQNLRKKIEGLPWNFSDLIAPTEVTNKATRNYTAGSYLILNNTLYKVTSNIANGGTITPNTNVTATTIMAEIMTL